MSVAVPEALAKGPWEMVTTACGLEVPRIVYTTVPGSGEPFYEDELDMGVLPPHSEAIIFLAVIFKEIADALGWALVCDNPVTYAEPENGEPRTLFPDLALTPNRELQGLVAPDLRLVVEVLSTHDRRMETRDRHYKRAMNECNGVPEFVLYDPNPGDDQPLHYYRLVSGSAEYVRVLPDGGSVYKSEAVPGLAFRTLPAEAQQPGVRVEVLFRGQRLGTYGEERQRAEQERQRAERLAEKLRSLGIDPTEL